MALADDCADVNAVDFSYPFLSGIDATNPPATITIPSKFLDTMGNMERQYWEIKARHYNVLIFFKKGKFYELYDHDAVIGNKEFGLKMVFDTTNRGKMRLAGVPEQSFSEWARLFVFRGYKVGRVEQMVKGGEDDSPGAAKAKIVPRELVQVLTPGTLTDAAMLSDHSEVFLLALAPRAADGVVDAVAMDLSRHVVYWCPCGSAVAVRRYRQRHGRTAEKVNEEVKEEETDEGDAAAGPWNEAAMRSVTALLQQLHPREVVMPAVAAARKAEVLCSDALAKWVQADGFPVDVVPMATAPTSSSSPAVAPTALETITQYLRYLKLDREVALLDEAVPYGVHLASAAAAGNGEGGRGAEGTAVSPATTAAGPSGSTRGAGMGLLEWERRLGEGLVLDSATVSNLEIVANLHDGTEKQSLHQCLNRCITNGGKRLFRAWLLRPSASATVIRQRQAAVRFLLACGMGGHGNNELWGQCGRGGARGAAGDDFPMAAAVSVSAGSTPDVSPSLTELGPRVSGIKRAREAEGEERNGSQAAGVSSTSSHGSQRSSQSGSAHFAARFANMLAVDFERSLSRLAEIKNDDQHQTISYVDPLVQYHKNLGIILATVQAFSEMVDWAAHFHAMCRRHCSAASSAAASQQDVPLRESQPHQVPRLLEELLFSVEAAAESVTAMERLFDRRVAAETGLLTPARGTSAAYDAATDTLATIEAKLHAYRHKAQEEVFGGAPVGFVDVGKDIFLVEVAANYAPKLTPKGMVERTRSGKSVKYVVDALAGLVEAHKEATAAKSAALVLVLQSVAAKMCEHCPLLYGATSSLAYLDCLINLARLAGRFPNMTFPNIIDAPTITSITTTTTTTNDTGRSAHVEATDLVHPLLTAVNIGACAAAPVPNTLSLAAAHGRLLVLTGPNMAGKSTLMRTVAVNVIMAQLGGPVLATHMDLSPVSRVFTRIGARDATQKGQSTLYVELNETAEILRSADGRSLCLIDELGRGTSTHDGLAIAHATLQALKEAPTPPLTIFSTHYHSLAQEQARRGGGGDERKRVQLGYMDFALTADPATATAAAAAPVPKITFLYRLVQGICDRSYGVEVALMAGVSPALIAVARDKSAELATLTALHEDLEAIHGFLKN